jgi:hypothetical protein
LRHSSTRHLSARPCTLRCDYPEKRRLIGFRTKRSPMRFSCRFSYYIFLLCFPSTTPTLPGEEWAGQWEARRCGVIGRREAIRRKKSSTYPSGLGTEISSIWPEPFSVSINEIPGQRGTPLFLRKLCPWFTVCFPKNFTLGERSPPGIIPAIITKSNGLEKINALILIETV